ncbi:lipopolysaccharide core heptose(II) kinase RfaY [Planctomicrobium sp. SH661]|uniref:serine/threonine protein kinase n=1 Tax=Planctomicrobium sp. SH661 TaxID=3448124 RepID=UPI003F5B63E3
MSTSLESFVNVLRRSGLVDEPVIARSLDARSESGPSQSGENFAEFLVETDVITAWQAAKLLQGKHKGFFLGKYKLLRLLGKGGMSSVYLAEHVLMRRRCAIKVLPWKLVKDSSYLQRFHREAQAVAALDHPNIVRAYDIDHEKDGNLEIHFLVMEYVEGRNLFDLVQIAGPVDAVTAADYIRQGALGLAHAHKAGMVHRDVKPGNFIVDQHGTVKLMDLGLARVSAEDGDHSLTIAHDERVLGTADYLAPEQAVDSHLVDTRADLYSLGCTMYFLLTGRPPFNEGTLTQRLLAHQTKEPTPIETLRPDVPESLLSILRKLMVKDRDARIQTAEEAAAELTQWLSSQASGEEQRTQPVRGEALSAGPVGQQGDTLNPFTGDAALEIPTRKMKREEAGGLGDFLSSLSDVEPSSPRPSSSLIGKGAKSEPRIARDSAQKRSGSIDIPKPESTTAGPLFSDSDSIPAFRTTSGGSGKKLKNSDSAKQSRKSGTSALEKFVPPDLQTKLKPYLIPIIGGILVLGAVIAYLLFGRNGPAGKSSPGQAPPATAAVTPAAPAPATPQPEKSTRPAVTGQSITVGPTGNFGTLTEAIDYIRAHAFSSTGNPVREIRVAGNQTLRESISIDNSGLGSFPRDVRVVGEGDQPARLQSPDASPILYLNAVDQFSIENLVIDCTGSTAAFKLQGFMASVSLTRLRFENIGQTAIAGQSLSGVGDRPVTIQECTFTGSSKSARAIQLQPGSGQDSRDLQILKCRFLGPLDACVEIQGGADDVSISHNIFHDAMTGIVFRSSDPVIRQLTLTNNTFYGCSRSLNFDSSLAASSDKFTIQKNLFVNGPGPAIASGVSGTSAEKITQGAALNWSDKAFEEGSGNLNVFAAGGRTGEAVKFVSTDPGSTDFMKPESKELATAADGSPSPSFIGAVAP